MRKRNALLEALELLRSLNADFTINQLIALLYVADEEDPLPLPDLRRRAGLTSDAAWKSVQALADLESETFEGERLVAVERWTMGSIVAARLQGAGTRLAAQLDQIIRDANPIVADGSAVRARDRA